VEAIVRIAGKQYRVAEGQQVAVDRLPDAAGQKVTFDSVLMLSDGDKSTIGTPLVEGARIEARVLRQDRGDKVLVYKYKPKKRYRRTRGHRAALSVLEVLSIAGPGAPRSRAAKKTAPEPGAAEEGDGA
jgi:large subunit ribosomal protein L21